MTPPPTSPPPAPADFDARLLHFLGGLRDRADLSPDRLAAAIGLPVSTDPGNPHRYGLGVDVGDGWACQLATLPGFGTDPPQRLVVSYDDLARRTDPPLPDAAPEYAGFAHRLRDAGYAEQVIDGPRGAIWGHRFVRDGIAIDVRTERGRTHRQDAAFRVARLVVETATATGDARHG